MKHNVMKRTLAGVMAVLTVAAYMPANVGGFLTEGNGIGIVASAEGELQVVDTAEAFKAAVEEGTSVKLTANIELASTVNVTKDVTIDLNGKNITANDARALWVKSGTLTLNGTGTITTTGNINSSSSVIRVGSGTHEKNLYTVNGTTPAGLYIGSGVTVSSDKCYGVSVFGSDTKETVNIYGKVKVTGSECALTGNGYDVAVPTTINIYDGAEITATNDVAIYHPQEGTLTVTGGTITGTSGIEAKAGTVNISGANTVITATNDTLYHVANGNGTSTKGYAVACVDNEGYKGNAANVTISGGTMNGAVDKLVDSARTDNQVGTLDITGGNFIINVSDDNYALKSDVTVDSLTIANGVEATIDLKGLDLTVNGRIFVGTQAKAGATVANGSNLVLTNSSSTDATVNTTKGAKVAYYGKMTVDAGVTLTSSATQALWYLGNTVIDIYGSVTTDCVDNAAVSGIGNKVTSTADDSYNGVVNIYEGAKIISANENGIYQPNDGILNIYGGTITGSTGIYVKSGVVNITGGTVNGTGDYKAYVHNGNGGNSTGDALVIEASDSGYANSPTVSISNGFFNSDYAQAVAAYKHSQSPYELPTGFITGGYFSSDVSTYVAPGYYQDNGTVKSDTRTDISNAKITVNYDDKNRNSSFTYNNYGSHNIREYGFTVKVGDTILTEHEDFEIYEGDTEANLVGTYVFKIRGIGDYKGTAVGNWSISDNHTITVFDSKDTFYQSKYTSYGKAVTVTAPSGTWNDCMCWMALNTSTNSWDIVSYSESYSFIALKDVTLKFDTYRTPSDQEVADKSVLTMSASQTKYGGNNAVKFTFNRNIDTKYTVQEVGVLYGTNKLAGADTSKPGYLTADLMTIGSEYGIMDLAESLKTSNKIKKFVASSKNYNGTVEFSYGVGSYVSYYTDAIGYVTVRDKETGIISTLYSNPVSASYNSAV